MKTSYPENNTCYSLSKILQSTLLTSAVLGCVLIPTFTSNAQSMNFNRKNNTKNVALRISEKMTVLLADALIELPRDEKAERAERSDKALYPTDSNIENVGRPSSAPSFDTQRYFLIRQAVLKGDLSKFIELNYYHCVDNASYQFGLESEFFRPVMNQCTEMRNNALESLSKMPQVDFAILDNKNPNKNVWDSSPVKAVEK